jgi:hypothetical protein
LLALPVHQGGGHAGAQPCPACGRQAAGCGKEEHGKLSRGKAQPLGQRSQRRCQVGGGAPPAGQGGVDLFLFNYSYYHNNYYYGFFYNYYYCDYYDCCSTAGRSQREAVSIH